MHAVNVDSSAASKSIGSVLSILLIFGKALVHVFLVALDEEQPVVFFAENVFERQLFTSQPYAFRMHDFKNDQLKPRYDQNGDFSLANQPFPQRELVNRWAYSTIHTFGTFAVIRGDT